VKKEYVPVRGDMVWITAHPRTGHEQSGRRPVVVLSPESYNRKVGLAMFCPITGRIKGYPFEVLIPGESAVSGVILADQAKNFDWRARKAEFICRLPSVVVEEVLNKLLLLLE